MNPRPLLWALALCALGAPAAAAPAPQRNPGPDVPSTPVLAPASGGEAAGPERLKLLAKALDKAEEIVAGVELTASGGADGSGCPPDFVMSDYLRDSGTDGFAKILGPSLGLPDELRYYLVCRALAANDPNACAAAAGAPPMASSGALLHQGSEGNGASSPAVVPTYEAACRESYYQARLSQAYLSRDPRFAQICAAAVPHLANFRSPAAIADACRAMFAYDGKDPEPFVRAVQAGVVPSLKRAYALSVLAEMTARPGSCAGASEAYGRTVCGQVVAYGLALKARRASKCDGGICRALMGLPAATCEPYATQLKKRVCGPFYTRRYLAAKKAEFKTLTDQVEVFLSGSSEGLGGVADLKRFNALVNRLSDLRARFSVAERRITAAAGKTAPRPARRR